MPNPLIALALVLAATLWRAATVLHPAWSNIAPIAALAFCGAAYLRSWRWALVPYLALTVSDLWLNHYHAVEFGYTWTWAASLPRLAAFAGAALLGVLVARRRTLGTVAAGSLGSSLLFYLVTNTAAWAGDAYYPATLAGWIQALTVGHPQFPSTLWFFRNTLAGDLAFTAVFAAVMEAAVRRQPAALRIGSDA